MRLSTSHIGIAIVKRERGVLATERARENQERWRFFLKDTVVTYRVVFGIQTRTRCVSCLVWA